VQAGVEFEGEEPPKAEPDDVLAFHAHSMLANGMGGVDWTGLPLACAVFGVRDVEALIHRMLVIKMHRTEKDG